MVPVCTLVAKWQLCSPHVQFKAPILGVMSVVFSLHLLTSRIPEIDPALKPGVRHLPTDPFKIPNGFKNPSNLLLPIEFLSQP